MKLIRLFFLTIILASCTLGKPVPIPQTPASVIAVQVFNRSPLVDDFHLFGIRATPDNKLAGVYSYTEAVNGSSTSFTLNTGIAIVEPGDSSTWRVIIDSETIDDYPVKINLPIDFFIFSGETSYAAVYGPVLENDVKTVEITFADGTVGREAISRDFYLIFFPGGSTPCEIQALGASRQVLYSATLFAPYSKESEACASFIK